MMGLSGDTFFSTLITGFILAVLVAVIDEVPQIILRAAATKLDPAQPGKKYKDLQVPFHDCVSSEAGISPLRMFLIGMRCAIGILKCARRSVLAETSSQGSHLFPHERRIVTVRAHPAMLIAPGAGFGGTLAAGIWTASSGRAASGAGELVWSAWLLLAIWLLWRISKWLETYYVFTNQRILKTSGVLRRRVMSLPISRTERITFHRSAAGKIFGYGDILVQSKTGHHPPERLSYVPYPEQVFPELEALKSLDRNHLNDS